MRCAHLAFKRVLELTAAAGKDLLSNDSIHTLIRVNPSDHFYNFSERATDTEPGHTPPIQKT